MVAPDRYITKDPDAELLSYNEICQQKTAAYRKFLLPDIASNRADEE